MLLSKQKFDLKTLVSVFLNSCFESWLSTCQPERQVNSDASALFDVFSSKNHSTFRISKSGAVIHLKSPSTTSSVCQMLSPFVAPEKDYRSPLGKCIGNIYSPLSIVNPSGEGFTLLKASQLLRNKAARTF